MGLRTGWSRNFNQGPWFRANLALGKMVPVGFYNGGFLLPRITCGADLPPRPRVRAGTPEAYDLSFPINYAAVEDWLKEQRQQWTSRYRKLDPLLNQLKEKDK